jgi:hypothetical protein
MFDNERIFRVRYTLPARKSFTTKSIDNREATILFIRRILDAQGTIDSIKYDGKAVSPEETAGLIGAAGVPEAKEQPALNQNIA